jgi:uncharacterized membrane protein
MSGEILRGLVLLAATMTTGLVAGTFALYAHTVMPGLRTTDDRTFVGAFQALDRAIINPWFMAGGFLGSAVLGVASVVVSWNHAALPWTVVALALYGFSFIATIAVNVPLNDALKAAGEPTTIPDLAQVRRQFDESRWAAWNLARTVATTASFGCLAWALFLHGRASP